MQLNIKQRKQLAEIFGNISVGWFMAGVVSPVFVETSKIEELYLQIIIGLTAAVLFAILSLVIIRR